MEQLQNGTIRGKEVYEQQRTPFSFIVESGLRQIYIRKLISLTFINTYLDIFSELYYFPG